MGNDNLRMNSCEISNVLRSPFLHARDHARQSRGSRKPATAHVQQEQTWLRATEDFQEGIKAASERRVADWPPSKSLAVQARTTNLSNLRLRMSVFGVKMRNAQKEQIISAAPL